MHRLRNWLAFATSGHVGFWLAVAWRISASLVVVLYYRHLGEGDILAYFHDLEVWRQTLAGGGQLSWLYSGAPPVVSQSLMLYQQPRAHYAVCLWLPLWSVCGGNWPLFVMMASLLGTYCLWRFYRQVCRYTTVSHAAVYVGLFLIPSMSLWTSPPLKEALIIPILFAYYGILLGWWHGKSIDLAHVVAGLCIILILLAIKYYYLIGAMLLTAAALLKRMRQQYSWCQRHWLPISFLLIAMLVLLNGQLHANLHWLQLNESLWQNHQDILTRSNPANTFWLPFDGSWPSLVRSCLPAIWTGLFRPLPFEGHWLVGLVLGIEGCILLGCVIILCWQYASKPPDKSYLNELHGWLLLYVLLNACMLAIASPNFIALSRYRLIFWSIWWIILTNAVISKTKRKRLS